MVALVRAVDDLGLYGPVGSPSVPLVVGNVGHAGDVGGVAIVRLGGLGLGIAPEDGGQLSAGERAPDAELPGVFTGGVAGDKPLLRAERHAVGIPLRVINVRERLNRIGEDGALCRIRRCDVARNLFGRVSLPINRTHPFAGQPLAYGRGQKDRIAAFGVFRKCKGIAQGNHPQGGAVAEHIPHIRIGRIPT